MKHQKSIIIVDPFSTGALYAKPFTDLGYRCYAVISNDALQNDFFQFDNHYFVNQQIYSVKECKQKLDKNDVAAVVIGAESGVIEGEKLAKYFGVMGNATDSSQSRRDKFIMQQMLKNHQLKHIKSQLINQDSADFFESNTGYIVKPINSAGSDGVVFLQDKAQLLAHLKTIDYQCVNALGEQNHQYLLQSYELGDEFVVDMVVNGDDIFIASLCVYQKGCHNGSKFVYENMQMLDIANPKYRQIIVYAKACVKALQVTFGAVHMELLAKFDQNAKYYIDPVMIEMGARLHGGVAPTIFEKCYSPNLLQLCVANYLGQNLHALFDENCHATLTHDAKVVFMINKKPNARLNQDKFLANAKTLSSFYQAKIIKDSHIPITVDLLTCPALVCLVGDGIDDDEKKLHTFFMQALD